MALKNLNLQVNRMMKYFVYDDQRKGTCYHEFYQGKWDEHTFWKADSISLHDDLLPGEFVEAITEVIPTYDPYGITEVSAVEWTEIGKVILTKDQKSQDVYKEADSWLEGVFQTHACFTILGI